MRIQTRIISIVALLLLLMLSSGYFALEEIKKVGSAIERFAQVEIPLTSVVTHLSSLKFEQEIFVERALRFDEKSGGISEIPFAESRAEFRRYAKLITDELEKGKSILKEASEQSPIRSYSAGSAEIYARLGEIDEAFKKYRSQATQIYDLVEKGDTRAAKLKSFTITSEESNVRESLEALQKDIDDLTKGTIVRVKMVRARSVHGIWAFTLLALLLGVSFAYIVARSITKPLSYAVGLANKVAKGEKGVSVDSKADGEIGQLLEAMSEMSKAIERSEDQLRDRNIDLERSNAELEQFAYVASHDLQEPLRMVASYTQLLEKRYSEKLDDTAREYIDFAVDGVGRMRALINDLLMYSRVGRRQKALEAVNTDDVLQRALSNLKIAIEESKAKIVVDSLPVVNGDEIQLLQLFQNLIANAMKFRNEDKLPQVAIGAVRNQREWVFSIADNGIGIEEQFSERIFEIFQRLHTREKYSGTGIGLAICRKIVERHGGKIWVESEIGKGTTIFFSIAD